ncbi:hypothetical protein COO60DRAFT_1628722 [Scenedesmus sp. NREL 46B-D3]|nr:hypothetical protein COO60DRAFT_1628722 [Scenedesmus sp. NREL 46B-D3]
MLGLLQRAAQLASTTLVYYAAFLCYYVGQQSIKSCPLLKGDVIAEVHLYSLAKQLLLWDEPHYRAATFADDLRANLKNVAIPGTGVPLSVFCYSRATALLFVLLVNPIACLAAACYLRLYRLSPGSPGSDSNSSHAGLVEIYQQLLLAPQHWFAIWRHNCVLMGYHALLTASTSYSLEDKGTFLLQGQRLGLPVSPFFQHATVFVKHKSIEGGMGINVFKNFAAGGEWIIQPALSNSASLAALLPCDAPLSTLRVVTASIAWLQDQAEQQGGVQDNTPQLQQERSSSSGGSPRTNGTPHKKQQHCSLSGLAIQSQQQIQQATDDSSALRERQRHSGAVASADCADSSGEGGQPQVQLQTGTYTPGPGAPPLPASAGVVRRLNVKSSSTCFGVDLHTGKLSPGVTANHWYRLGLQGLGRVDAAAAHKWQSHPDTGKQVAGCVVPGMADVLDAVTAAHAAAAPDLPLVGWDVALTPEGVFILEVNLSCNLFNGALDSASYYRLLWHYFHRLSDVERSASGVIRKNASL